MKICHLNVLWVLNHGLLKKFADQSQVFRELSNTSIEVEFVVIIRQRILEQITNKLPFRTITIPTREPQWLEELLLPFDTWRIIEKQICPQCNATILRWIPPTLRAVRIARHTPLFTEHHSKELEEIRSQHSGIQSWGKYFLERFIAPLLLNRVAGIIGVTDEIRLYELSRSNSNAPSIVIPNGINPRPISTSTSRTYSGGQLNIAFLCSRFSEWQGLDRLLTGLLNYNSTQGTIHIHLIGRTSPEQEDFIKKNQLHNLVTLHSTLRGSQLNSILNVCNMAIGPLAIHRKGLTEASPLKCREYTARGLPFVSSFVDPDFPDDCPWILKVSADDSAIDIPTLFTFAKRMNTINPVSKQMRDWAENKLCWKKKFQHLLIFVQQGLKNATNNL